MLTPTLPRVPLAPRSALAAIVLVAGFAFGSPAALAGDQGLRWQPEALALETAGPPRWQSRFGLATRAPDDAAWTAGDGTSRLLGASLMGDYFFSRSAFERGGGFRATGGVLLGSRNPLWSGALGGTRFAPGLSAEYRDYNRYSLTDLPFDPDGNDATAVPYLGVGYTGLFGKRPLTGLGWGFSADLGLMSLSPGAAVRLGNVLGGQQSAGELVRELQLNPMLHLGVSYAF